MRGRSTNERQLPCLLSLQNVVPSASHCHSSSTLIVVSFWSLQTESEGSSLNHLRQSIDAIIIGCTITLSMIEEYIIEAQKTTGSSLDPQSTPGRIAKIRIIWNEDEIKELLQQLRAYQLNLTSLLTVIQRSEVYLHFYFSI